MDYANAFGIEFRSTRETAHEGAAARSVSGSRHYDTQADDLWDALTNPERISRWFLPISGDLRLGGRYQLEGHAGGKITRCDPASALDASWEYGDNTSWVMVRLVPESDGTRLTLEHVMLKDDAGEAHWKLYGPGATGVGWELSFLALDYHLTNNGAKIIPKESEAWMVSANGKTFLRKSAKSWGDAHIASGEAEVIARNMAESTSKFYTGE
ncbi:MAG: polyketide cyclase [Robiginitomaculum sp.]|nr:MAG: polyketide cyclase [Robiginitomaculum sp.]